MSTGRLGVTERGLEFLKCAIAASDFPGVKPDGVPDRYAGNTFTMRHQTASAQTGDLWIVVAPTPGVAFWWSNLAPTSSTTWTPVYYGDFGTMFPNPTGNPLYGRDNVSKFRYISSMIKIESVGSENNTQGVLTACRMPGIGIAHQSIPQQTDYISGMSKTNVADQVTQPGYVQHHVRHGVSMSALNEGDEFEFNDIWYGNSNLPSQDGSLNGTIMGWGGLTPLVVTLTATTSASYVVRCECCIEYIPTGGSLMAEMSSPSPPHDERALELYSKAKKSMPVAVKAAENAGFWDHFLRIVGVAAGPVGRLFGPVGAAVGSGVGALAGALHSLVI